MAVVGVVSPGTMGSAVAYALARGGARVITTVAGRSERTVRLAKRAGVECLRDLAAVVETADVVLSIVPPEAAPDVAGDVLRACRDQDVQTLLVDLNAIAPATALRIEAAAAATGDTIVDGSISGPPPWKAGTTRVYLSGARAEEVAGLPLDGAAWIVVGSEVGSASAVKMSTASVYKGSTALLLQALRAADANGVLEHVLADLRTGSPELVTDVERRLASAAAKAGRYVAEMREIAATQADAGLTPALFEAMAKIYATVAETRLAETRPEDIPSNLSLLEVLDGLRREASCATDQT